MLETYAVFAAIYICGFLSGGAFTYWKVAATIDRMRENNRELLEDFRQSVQEISDLYEERARSREE